MISEVSLRACLRREWGLADATTEVHDGGMNSATWFVSEGPARWVAKAVVPASRRSFARGLAVAAAVDAAGIPAGAPEATRRGECLTDVDGIPLALLRWVPGAPLAGVDPGEQRLIGSTLARVHEALAGVPVADAQTFHWVDPAGEHLALRPWIRSAVAGAVARYDELGPLSWGLLHTDPAPEAFLLDRVTGACGLIDWGVAMAGPLLYDLASAVMYVGGPDRATSLVDAYLAHGTMPSAEVDHGLATMLTFRWAVQADYFARRIAAADLTGIASTADNERGLEHARRGAQPRDGPTFAASQSLSGRDARRTSAIFFFAAAVPSQAATGQLFHATSPL